MCTVPSHLICCSLILALASIFRQGNELTYDAANVRCLAERGRKLLRQIEPSSSIARRGGVVIDSLFELDDAGDHSGGEIRLDVNHIVRQVLFADTLDRQRAEGCEVEDPFLPFGTDSWDEIFGVMTF